MVEGWDCERKKNPRMAVNASQKDQMALKKDHAGPSPNKGKKIFRHRQDLNLRAQSATDNKNVFKSVSLTSRTLCRSMFASFLTIYITRL